MKKCIIIFIVIVSGSKLYAQTIFEKWEELNNYHQIMSQTFHPAEKDNLEPVKTNAEELSKQATALAESKIPMEFESEQIRKSIAQLKTDSEALYKLIEEGNASDKEIKEAIYALHDVYHTVVGLCNEEDHK